MNKLLVIKFFSGVVNILICLIAAAVILFRQNWFGKGDTYAFLFWTVPFAVAISVSGNTILNFYRTTPFPLRFLLIVLTSGLLSICWTYCVFLLLGPWMNAFSIPVLYLWIGGSTFQLLFLDWRLPKSPVKTKISKAIIGILSFPLALVLTTLTMYLLSALSSYLSMPEKETYLIPNDFEGNFRVIYGEKCGINPSYENGRRVLRIPDNGVLIIQPEFEPGIIDHEYYFVDRKGNRQKIKMFLDYNERMKGTPGVLLGGSGSFGGTMPDGSSSGESEFAIHFTDFTVFNTDTTSGNDESGFNFQSRFDSLTNALVDQCRHKNGL
jgi:hypothetical protein